MTSAVKSNTGLLVYLHLECCDRILRDDVVQSFLYPTPHSGVGYYFKFSVVKTYTGLLLYPHLSYGNPAKRGCC